MRKTLFLFCLVVVLLSSCQDDGTRYHRYSPIRAGGWEHTDSLTFALPANFTYHQFEVEIGVRHDDTYPYQDLWVAVVHPLTPAIQPDTIHITLADEQGNWRGEGTAGCFRQHTSYAGKLMCYPADSVLQIVPLMADSVLPGISDIGLKLNLPGSINTEKYK